jgi:cobaltochelatase CobN
MRRVSRLSLSYTCIASAVWFALSFVPSPACAADVLFVVGDSTSVAVAKGVQEFRRTHPDVAAKMRVEVMLEAGLDQLKTRGADAPRVLLIDSHSEGRSAESDRRLKAELIARVSARGKVFALGDGAAPRNTYTSVGAQYDEKLRAYWGASGPSWQNVYGLLCVLAREEFGASIDVPAVLRMPERGYYHPAAPNSRILASYDDYRRWYAKRERAGQPWVAVPFYGSFVQQEQTAVLDAVIAEAEKQKLNVLPLFGYPEDKLWREGLLDEKGKPRAQAVLSFTLRFNGPEMGELIDKAGIPVLNLIKVYARSEKDWRDSKEGLSTFESVFQVAIPELSGVIAPTVVGTEEKRTDPTLGAEVVVAQPLPERVEIAVKRVKRYLELQRKPNSEKRLALIYYNYPPGKANIGASYLNTLRSIAAVLQRLKAEGYDVGAGPLTEEEVTRRALSGGRNVGSYAPGDLEEMVKAGKVIRVPASVYRKWFESLPAAYREQVARDWGEPDVAEGMWLDSWRGLELIVPATMYGKVAVLPQPDRGFGQNLEKLYHSMDTTPPHHYSGVYRWLRDEFKADALVHVGTHGTLEWLSGKTMGLTESDAPDVMISDLPNVYLYNVDVVGEGLVAKRRGMASIVDHMIPPLKKGGLYGDYAQVSELANDYESAIHKSPRLAAGIAKELRDKLHELGVSKELGLSDRTKPLTHDDSHKIEDYFSQLKNQNMPYGLHTFGWAPPADLRASTVEAIMEPDRGLNPLRRTQMATDMDERIQASGPRELMQMIAALNGRYIAAGTGNDPVRNPDSLPTGKSFYGIDPSKVPKKTAWELGVKLADEMLLQHLQRDGRYPKKVAFVIWGTETLRHEGVAESQFFHLLGTRPVWNERGKVVDVEVVSRAKLGRPRVDVVVSSAADGMFGQLTELMDKAVQKVNLLEEPDNYVREHTLSNAKRLAQKGHDDRVALRRASIRIFDEPPGQYNLNVARIVQNSGTWESEGAITNDYFQKMGHGFGNGSWGESMEDAFRLTLSGTEKIVHSRTSTLYGTLDNDDFFMYAGGLAQAVRSLDGKSPELLVADLQSLGKERLTPIAEFMGQEFRSRSTNPLWIEGMMKEGYAGAHEMRSQLENLWGWQVTLPESVGQDKWDQAYRTYVEDQHSLGLKEWFTQHSPFARQDMIARLIEANRKGAWQPEAATIEKLVREFVESANTHGFSCSALTCQNPVLAQFTLELGLRAGIPEHELKTFEQKLQSATGRNLQEAARQMREFIADTEQRHRQRAEQVSAGRAEGEEHVKGKVMQKQSMLEAAAQPLLKAARDHRQQLLMSLVLVVFAVAGWFWLRARARLHRLRENPS